MKKILSLVIILSAFSQISKAQQGFGTSNPAPSSVIDMVATNKGVLMPRVALTSLTAAAPVSSPADALTVFNTATAGSAPNNVTPGYYYWSQADLKWVRLSSSADEPWNVQGGTAKAFANTQDIYQNGKVGIGDFSATSSPQKQLEVKGDFKSEISAAGGAVGTEVGSPLNPNGAMHYWFLNPTNYRTASANDFSATLEAKTGNVTNTITARDIQAALSSQNGTNSLSSVRANNAGEFYMEAFNVTGNYGSTVSLLSDALRLVHTDTNGPLDPFPNNNRSEIKVQKAEGVGFSFRNAIGGITGNYWFPTNTGTNGQVMTQTGTGQIVWATPGLTQANNGLTRNTTTNEIELGGTLNRTTVINMGGTTTPLVPFRQLSFETKNSSTYFSEFGGFHHEGKNTSDYTSAFIRISSPDKVVPTGTNGRTFLDIQTFEANSAQIFAQGDVRQLAIGTAYATNSAPIVFYTTNGGVTNNGVDRMRITSTGEVLINTGIIPTITVGATTVTPKLHIAGDVSTTGKYYTSSSVYADYVFEKYFAGSSVLNPSYEFKSLNYVKDFIKKNHHLPGVEAIGDLAKTENGYTFDMTKLTIQSLEKIEELYLHIIEQNDKINDQNIEIEKLKKEADETNKRLERLEKLLIKK